jgi:hypothetical protein
MTLKVTLQMSENRSTWGETHYYIPAADPSDTDAQAAATKLATLRANLLGFNAVLLRARICRTDKPRICKPIRFNPPLVSPYTAATGEAGILSADQPNASVLVEFQTRQFSMLAKKWLAGIIDVEIETDPQNPSMLSGDPNFVGPFNKYAAYLTNGSWGTALKTNPVSQQCLAIFAQAATPAHVGVTVQNPFPLGTRTTPVGMRLQLRGFHRTNPKSPGLNGMWSVHSTLTNVDGTMTYFLEDSQAVDPANFWTKGLVQTIDVTYDAYLSLTPQKAVSRKRGGSIELPAGRRKTLRSHG